MRVLPIIIIMIIIGGASAQFFSMRPHTVQPAAAVQPAPLSASTESATSQPPPLPPPSCNFSIGVLSPLDRTRKTITYPPTSGTTIQAAPNSPLIIYVGANLSVTLAINGDTLEVNTTSGWETLYSDLGQGTYYNIWISLWNATIVIYVLTPGQEDDLKEALKPPQMDPRWVKRIWAVMSAIVAILLGIPLGVRLREKISSKTWKNKVEEL